MTAHQERLDALVDDMLLDSGLAGDGEARAVLLSLGALRSLPAPAPTGELAKLLAAPSHLPAPAVDAAAGELERRRRRRTGHRPTLLGVALIAGMATGIVGVAASAPAPGQEGSHSVQELLAGWSPSWALPVPPLASGTLPADPSLGTGQVAELGQDTEEAFPAPRSGPIQTDGGGQTSADQNPGAVPAGAGDLPGHESAGNDGGTGRAGTQDDQGGPSVVIPAPGAGGPGAPAFDVPADTNGNGLAGDGRLTDEAAKPLDNVLRPVAAATAAGKPALQSWLQKFKR